VGHADSLPGWSVHDTVAHLIGTESALAGQAPPPSGADIRGLPHVRNDIGAANEQWVQGLRGESSDAMLDRTWHVLVDRRARLVDTLPGPPTAAVRLTSHLFSRLAGGRGPAAEHLAEITVDGDQDLGCRVALALPFTI
jgi:hypothetical protein